MQQEQAYQPLLNLISKNDIEEVKKILPQVEDINAKDKFGFGYLHNAVLNNSLQIARYLIENTSININAEGKDNFTALHYAVANNNPEMVKLLIEGGAKINAPNKEGNTPLWLAVMRYKNDDSSIKVLLKAGADPSIPNKHGVTLNKLLTMPKNKGIQHLFS